MNQQGNKSLLAHPCSCRYEGEGVVEGLVLQHTWVLVDVLHGQLGCRVEEHVTLMWGALGLTTSARKE